MNARGKDYPISHFETFLICSTLLLLFFISISTHRHKDDKDQHTEKGPDKRIVHNYAARR